MKLIIAITVCIVLFIYAGGYYATRSANSASVVTTLPSGNRTNVCTCLMVPPGGAGRTLRYSLFYLYYPLGRLENSCTRREYELMDFSSYPGAPHVVHWSLCRC